MKGRPVKARFRLGMVALIGAGALALSGCGAADTAAVVDGQVISEQAVHTATMQYNEQVAAQTKRDVAANKQPTLQPLTTDAVVNWFVWAPTLLDEAAAFGQPQSESVARAALTDVQDPAPSTIELVRAQNALQAIRGDVGASQKVLDRIHRLDVTVNPRYGTFDPQTGLLGVSTPNWLPTPTPTPSNG